jgi:dihydroneopterin aldolase
MTLFMASVRCPQEARLALGAGADVIDIKEPADGALGAASPETARAIVAAVGGAAAVSVTIGDVLLAPGRLEPAIRQAAGSGADVIKAGLFPGDLEACLPLFAALSRNLRLAAVIFVDTTGPGDAAGLLAALGKAGFTGAVLDTADKSSGGLTTHWSAGAISSFIGAAQAHGLFAGLSGSLRSGDIPALLPLAPDLLGFRGALCTGGRSGPLSAARCESVRALIPRNAGTAADVHGMLAGLLAGTRGDRMR